jgi:hypothetical protein
MDLLHQLTARRNRVGVLHHLLAKRQNQESFHEVCVQEYRHHRIDSVAGRVRPTGLRHARGWNVCDRLG